MSPLVNYYLRQAGRRGAIGPVLSLPPIHQRGHGIGSFLGGLWRSVRPILWSGAKDFGKQTLRNLGRETIRPGGKILTEIAENQSPDVSTQDIISKNLSESAQNLFTRFQERGRKRKRKRTTNGKAKKACKKRKRSA
jgi:hypothetical protein